MEIGVFVLGLNKLLWPGLAILFVLFLFGGTSCVGDLGGFGRFLWGWGEKTSVYEMMRVKFNGVLGGGEFNKLDLMLTNVCGGCTYMCFAVFCISPGPASWYPCIF
jgi:hypothetical protein